MEAEPCFRVVALAGEARLPLSVQARRASPGEAREASLLLLAAAAFQSSKEPEAQFPWAARLPSWKAALREETRARLPIFEAEPFSPQAVLAEGRRGTPVFRAERRSRKDTPGEEAWALARVLAAGLMAPA